jgi:uncharacterized protein (DUF488 family)
MSSQGGSAFYHFVPYHYGPFSFCLYREIDQLVSEGLVESPDARSWQILGQPDDTTGGLSNAVKQDVARILHRFEAKPTSYLVNYVYQQYPWFTVNSRQNRHATRPIAPPAVYTAGYEGLQVDAFLNMLMRSGIQQLLDVRSNPVSRRYGFHKTTLGRLCQSLGIDYIHRPELGILPVLRQSLKTQADYESLFSRYEAEVLTKESVAVEEVSQLVLTKPTVLVCMESDPKMCHRTRLANAVSHRNNLPVRDLEPPE